LDGIVRSGKALYIGISNYKAEEAKKAIGILKNLGTPCIIHQPKYSMFERWVEEPDTSFGKSLLDVLGEEGVGCIPFSPLAQGLLTDKYLKGIPIGSRAEKDKRFLKLTDITEEIIIKISKLNDIAISRNQTLAQMALAWILKDDRVTSVLIGASSAAQVLNSIACLENLKFSNEELNNIEVILNEK
jgi:L-glyceraldehyde 3-phosphate reductase